jgi:hypothetical protein
MHPQLLEIWIKSKESHLKLCQEMGIVYTADSIQGQLHLLDQLKELAGIEKPEDVELKHFL